MKTDTEPGEPVLRPSVRASVTWEAVGFVLIFGPWLIPYVFSRMEVLDAFRAYKAASTMAAILLAGGASLAASVWLVAKALGRDAWPAVPGVLRWCVMGVAICALVQAFFVTVPRPLPRGAHDMPFDSATWAATDASKRIDGELSSRQRMLASVLEEIVPSRTAAEIQANLGQSEETSLESPFNKVYFQGGDVSYRLGFHPEYGTVEEWLFLWMGPDGRFERYRIAQMAGIPTQSKQEAAGGVMQQLVLALFLLAVPASTSGWSRRDRVVPRASDARGTILTFAATCVAMLLAAAYLGPKLFDLGGNTTYFLLKLFAYSAWSWCGLVVLTQRRSPADAVLLGIARVVIGIFFAFPIWLGSSMVAEITAAAGDWRTAQVLAYIFVYVPMRWLEWGILESFLRQDGEGSILFGTSSLDRQWRAGGVAVSCAADAYLFVALGRIPIGGLMC